LGHPHNAFFTFIVYRSTGVALSLAMALEFPIIFLLPAHLESEALHDLEEQIPTLTYDINEAEIILGKISQRERALFELRKHRLATEEVTSLELSVGSPRRKRLRATAGPQNVPDSDEDEDEDEAANKNESGSKSTVKVVKLAWFVDSLAAGKVLPLDGYLVYEGRRSPPTQMMKPLPNPNARGEDILLRAMADSGSAVRPRSRGGDGYIPRPSKPPLLRQTTSEHGIDVHLPPIPAYLHTTYSCQRPTPVHPPNEPFIEQLTKIRTARTLVGDKIGVRAYSSAIATLAAYPYTLSSAQGTVALYSC